MANLAPMGAPRFLAFPVLALLAGSCVVARAQDQSPPPASSSTTQTIHEKTGPNSSRTIRRTTVLKEASSPELGQAEAEQFLRAATQLKPTSHVSEGQYRAWLSLAQVLEKHNFVQALSAYHQAAILQPKEAEPHLAAGRLLEQENKFSDAEQEYKRALALDPASDALTGLANVYMRGR